MRARLLALATPFALALAAPSGAFALNINENYKPQNEFKLEPWITIKIGGLDLSINKAVFYVILASVLTCGVMIWIGRRMSALGRPGYFQVIVEGYYGLVQGITKGNLDGKMLRRWFPFLAAIFLFIWFSNMLGYLPLPTNTEHKVDIFGLQIPSFALYAATANLSVPLVLTFCVVLSYHYEGIRAKGFVNYLKGWVPAGVEGPAVFPIFLIEVISHFVRIVSLSVRLFANILAGHLLILFMGGGLVVLLGIAALGFLTIPIAIAFYLFEVGLVATLQAFIFATLTAIYLGGATAESH